MKIACIILTNKNTKEMYKKNYSELTKMSLESKYNVDIYTYYNDEKENYKVKDNTIYFSYKYLQDEFNYHHTFLKLPYIGNTILTLFDFYINHKDYDSYMFFEDDIMYNSDKNLFDEIFDNFKNRSYDIIFQNKRKINSEWSWNNQKTRNCTFDAYVGLLNIYVIKPKLINDLIDFISKGNYAHHEYLVNGFVLSNNYKVRYLDEIFDIYASYTKIDKLDKLSYDIIHPIKKISEFNKLKKNSMKPFKTCVMTMAKNERLYIKEWVDYHLNIGFDDIFIFEDYDSESHKDILKGYNNVHIQSIRDTGIEDYRTCETQMKLFHYFLNKLREEKKYDWCLFTDVDEFLVLNNISLQELCFEYQTYNGLLLSWKLYNASGHVECPEGNVIDNYTETSNIIVDGDKAKLTEWSKKSFVNINKGGKFLTNHCLEGAVDIDEHKNVNNDFIYRKAWINHYFTKSWEDFCYRMEIRGNMGNNNRNYDQFFKVNPNMNHLKKKLIFQQRYKHNNNVHYISKEFKLISGGNLRDVELLNETV